MEEQVTWLVGGSVVLTILIAIIATICSILPFVAIFGGLFYWMRKNSQKAAALNAAAQSWPSTSGQVVKSRVEVSGGDHTSVTPHVEYQYDVGGITYQSSTIQAGHVGILITTSQSAYDTVDRYPVGAAVTVYYNPANPAQAALER